mgnify:CR=1 FL=1
MRAAAPLPDWGRRDFLQLRKAQSQIVDLRRELSRVAAQDAAQDAGLSLSLRPASEASGLNHHDHRHPIDA